MIEKRVLPSPGNSSRFASPRLPRIQCSHRYLRSRRGSAGDTSVGFSSVMARVLLLLLPLLVVAIAAADQCQDVGAKFDACDVSSICASCIATSVGLRRSLSLSHLFINAATHYGLPSLAGLLLQSGGPALRADGLRHVRDDLLQRQRLAVRCVHRERRPANLRRRRRLHLPVRLLRRIVFIAGKLQQRRRLQLEGPARLHFHGLRRPGLHVRAGPAHRDVHESRQDAD